MARNEMRAEVSYSRQDKPDGSYRLYNSSGSLQATGAFENGKRVGLWTFWDSRGIKIVELTYVDGMKEGPCRMWFGSFASPTSAGRMKLEARFSNGLQNGEKRTWWANGRPRCETTLDAGVVTGARCWTGEGERVASEDAIKAAYSELEADAKYLAVLDGIVEDSLRDAAEP